MKIVNGRFLCRSSSRHGALCLLLGALAVIASESSLMAQPQPPTGNASPLPPWYLPPDVEDEFDYRVGRTSEWVGIDASTRDYEKARASKGSCRGLRATCRTDQLPDQTPSGIIFRSWTSYAGLTKRTAWNSTGRAFAWEKPHR